MIKLPKDYDWFRIVLSKRGDGEGYSLTALSSFYPDDKREAEFVPPFGGVKEQLRSALESIIRSRQVVGVQGLERIGRVLYESLFPAEIEKFYRTCLKSAKRNGGLRIELCINPLDFRRLPWELMHDGKDFLARSKVTPIVRVYGEQEPEEFNGISYPLGILFLAASPLDSSSVDVGGEILGLCRGLSDSIKEGKVLLRCYGAKKFKSNDFLEEIRSGKYHVLHVSSHGAFLRELDKGVIELEDEQGGAIPVSIGVLGDLIKDSSIQLVYLDACQTGVGSTVNPSAQLSHELLDKGIGAVVAMQFSVPVEVANKFCETFYYQLLKGEPIGCCMSEARIRTDDLLVGTDKPDWAIPVLHVRKRKLLGVSGKPTPKKSYKALPAPALFVGRQTELSRLTEYLIEPEVSIITVDGFGGIGKSTIINRLVSDLRGLFEDVCWIDCRSTTSQEGIIQEINEMLLCHGKGLSEDELAGYLPESKNSAIAYALENGDFLLVFDNIDTVQAQPMIVDLIQKLGECKKTKTLISLRIPKRFSRRQRPFTLYQLKEENAILLMRRLGEKEGIQRVIKASEDDLKKINARVDGHPKAIEIVVLQMKNVPLDKILEDLPKVLADDIDPVLEWTFNKLKDKEKRFLIGISVYDGDVPYDALKALHSQDNIRVLVNGLVDSRLLSYDDVRELYSLHPIVREFAYRQLSAEERKRVHRLAAKYFLGVKYPLNAIDHMYKAEDWKKGIELTQAILEYLKLRGVWLEAKSKCEQGLNASRKIKNEKTESYFLYNLAEMFERLGQYNEAEEICKQSLEILQKLGDQRGIALSFGQLGRLSENKNQPELAENYYRSALEIFTRIGDKTHSALAKKDLERILSKKRSKKSSH